MDSIRSAVNWFASAGVLETRRLEGRKARGVCSTAAR
jgi:hypothetical protein